MMNLPHDYEIGDLVTIKLLDMDAYVTAICHRREGTTYELSYFANSEYYQKWMEVFEIEPKLNLKKTDVFLSQEQNDK